jgi:WD40 repeat protein
MVLTGHAQDVLAVAYSRDGSRVATGSADGTVILWDPSRGKPVLTIGGHGTVVRSVSFSPDGAHLATAGDDRAVRVFDAKTAASQMIVDDSAGGVRSVSYSPDGSRLLYAGGGGTARSVPTKLDAFFRFGCRVLAGLDLTKEVEPHCDGMSSP